MNKQSQAIVGSVLAFLFIAGIWWSGNRAIPEESAVPSVQNLAAVSDNNIMNNNIEGLQIEIITEGAGNAVVTGQTAVVDYTGMLIDGTVFDSSIPRGEPFSVHVGSGEVIKGWDLGIPGMKVGEKRKLTISPDLAYGKDGFPGVIPPSAVLIFEITLKAIQ